MTRDRNESDDYVTPGSTSPDDSVRPLVESAMIELMRQGIKPSNDSVRHFIGRGNNNTIGTEMKAAWARIGRRLCFEEQFPGSIDALARRLSVLAHETIDQARHQYQEASAAALAAKEDETAARIATAEQAQKEALDLALNRERTAKTLTAERDEWRTIAESRVREIEGRDATIAQLSETIKDRDEMLAKVHLGIQEERQRSQTNENTLLLQIDVLRSQVRKLEDSLKNVQENAERCQRGAKEDVDQAKRQADAAIAELQSFKKQLKSSRLFPKRQNGN